MAVQSNPRIVIHGYYGAGNFGDDIILISVIAALREAIPGANITVLSRNVNPIPTSQPIHIVSRFDTDGVLKAVKNTDLLVCGGGGLFQDYSGFDILDHFGARTKGINYYALPIEMAYLLKKPVMLYAVGAGPIKSPAYSRYLKTVLDWTNAITVRDQPSAALLEGINSGVKPIVTADPAVNFPHPGYAVDKPFSHYAAICLRSWFFKNGERDEFIRFFADMADNLVTHYGLGVVLFPFSKNKSDALLLEDVHASMQQKKMTALKQGLSMEQTLPILLNADYVVGMRLHSLIMSTSQLIPSLAIAYDKKVSQYMNALGMGAHVLSIENLNGNRLINKMATIINQSKQIKAQLKQAVGDLKEREKNNAALAASLIRRAH